MARSTMKKPPVKYTVQVCRQGKDDYRVIKLGYRRSDGILVDNFTYKDLTRKEAYDLKNDIISMNKGERE